MTDRESPRLCAVFAQLDELLRCESVLHSSLLEEHAHQLILERKLSHALETSAAQGSRPHEGAAAPAPSANSDSTGRTRIGEVDYQQLKREIREIVNRALPSGATVLVISKGDGELVKFGGRGRRKLPLLRSRGVKGWHFPRAEGGAYAGHYPADSREAVEHLEALRARGGDHLLVPHTSFWWLEHYEGLRRHLDANYRRVWDDQHCVIFNLS